MDGRKRSQLRSKRGQYVNQACNECKRRKTKCDGARPCRKCTVQSRICAYHEIRQPDAQMRKSVSVRYNLEQQLMRQVSVNRPANDVYQSKNNQEGRTRESLAPPLQTPTHPRVAQATVDTIPRSTHDSQTSHHAIISSAGSAEFCGPSSSEFTLNAVSGNLKAMGMPAAILDISSSGPGELSGSSHRLAQYGPFMKLLTMDPLWDMRKEDAIDLIQQWCDGVGLLYPVVSQEKMMETAENVFASLQQTQRDGIQLRKGILVETLFNDETTKLKIVLAIGRTLESGGRNDQAQRLFQSTTEAVEGLIWNSNGISGIQLLVLVALYHYHLDDEVVTGRITGFAARLCLEMGLHHKSMVERTFPNLEERSVALRTFWSVYMLERRTCLGQGIPYSIQDSHVAPSLFWLGNHSENSAAPARQTKLESNILPPLLEWTKLAGETWKALNSQDETGLESRLDNLDCLDHQILRWYEKLPKELKLDEVWLRQCDENHKPSYLQAVMFSRRSHLRNLIYRPVLHSLTRINQFQVHAESAVEIAKKTIQTFADVNEVTPFIRTHPIFFKHTLLATFGNLLLAVVNGGSRFWESMRAEFDISLGLIKLLSTRSDPLMRLWQRLQGLRELHTKLSRISTNDPPEGSNEATQNGASVIISFDDLFPALSPNMAPLQGSEQQSQQLYSRLDAPVGLGELFEFPFLGWT